MRKSWRFIAYFLVCALVTLAAYWNIFPNQYIWDDHFQIEHNAYIRAFRSLASFFTHDNWSLLTPDHANVGYWRPLFFSSYWLDLHIPLNLPAAHHAIDLFFYALFLTTFAFYLTSLGLSRTANVLSLLFFAWFPLHTEAVTFMGGRYFSIVATLWLIGFMNLHRPFIVLAGYLFSLLFYEGSILFPAIVLPLVWTHSKRRTLLVGLLTVSFSYLYVRSTVAPVHTYPLTASISDQIQHIGATAARSLRGFLWPFSFTVVEDPPYIIHRWVDACLGWMFILSLVAIPFGFRKSPRRIFFALWFSLPLFLFISPWPRGSVYQDRYLFLSSVPLSVGVAYLLERLHMLRIVVLPILVAFLFSTLTRNLEYRNDVTFWCSEANSYPSSFSAERYCGQALLENGKPFEAVSYFAAALELHPQAQVMNDYAVAIARSKGCEKAIPIFTLLHNQFPTFQAPIDNLQICSPEKATIR